MNKPMIIIGIILIFTGIIGGYYIFELVILILLGITVSVIGFAIGPAKFSKRTLGEEPTVFCTNCGSSIKKNAKFCPYCRKKL